MPNQPKSKIRYQLSPGMAAEWNLLRIQGGYASWDDFFSAMASRWRQNLNEPAPIGLTDRLDKIEARLEKMENLCRKAMSDFQVRASVLEGQGAILESLNSTQEQTHVLLQQFTTLLSIAFGDNEPKKEEPLPPGTMKTISRLQERIRSRSGFM